jgi:serine/threonine protein kinase
VSTSRSSSSSFRFVDQYGLLVCLGEGGMGEVWAARDPKAPKNRVVALKLTKQQGPEAAKVLWDEARIASLIDHPNVCRVHELGMADGVQYLVMDYCDGASLHDLLERLPGRMLTPPHAARIVANVGAGLHAAHELSDEHGAHMGVVHRDVSPQNVLISTAGVVTVADFGVARAAGQAHKATETGEMKGKLSYMAPEQVTSRDIDRRVDVFALGCVLYQVTLGKRPFHGEDALATLYQLLEKDLVRPTELDPAYPPELEQVLLKALAKNRDERFATAHDMQIALERFLVNSGQQVTDSDVGRLLLDKMGTEITARKEEIKRRSAAMEAAPVAVPPALERLETEAGTVSEAPPPVRSSMVVRVAAITVFLAVAGGSIFLIRDRQNAAPTSPSAGSAPAANSASTPGEAAVDGAKGPSLDPTMAEVRFTVLAEPPVARIELDGREVGVGRYQGNHRVSSELHRLAVSAPGYESQSREVDFEESRSLEIVLKRTPGALSRPRPAAPSPEPKPTAKAGTTAGAPNGKKPPRSLDSTNPFSNP